MGRRLKALIGVLVIAQLSLVAGNTNSVQAAGPASISGVVETEGGQPIEGAAVDLIDPASEMAIASTVTALDGTYLITDIAYGNYHAVSRVPGNQTNLWFGASFGFDVMNPPTGFTLDETESVRSDISFSFPTGGFTGQVLDDGVPVAGADVETVGTPTATDTTDASGTFDLGYLPDGEYQLRVFIGASDFTTINYSTDDTSVTGPIEITVPVGTVTGTVSSAGSPIDGTTDYAYVRLQDANGGQIWDTDVSDIGGFSFTRVPDGQYYVSFYNMDTDQTIYYPSAAGQDTATVLTLESGNRDLVADIALPDFHIDGTVTSGSNPVENATAYAYDTEFYMQFGSATTDANGEYSIGGLPEGTYRITVNAPNGGPELWYGGTGFDDATVLSINDATPTATAHVELPEGGFNGTITGDPSLLEFASLLFYNADTGVSGSTAVDESGNFSIGYLPEGNYQIVLQPMSGESTPLSGTYYTGTSITTIALTIPNGSVAGTVSDDNGPIDGTMDYNQVELRDIGTSQSVYTEVSDQGTYSFANIADGEYYISVYLMAGDRTVYYPNASDMNGATVIVVEDGNRALTGIDIELPNRTISGTVTDGLIGVDGLQVAAIDNNWNTVAYTYTDTNGNYTLNGLSDGSYRIFVYIDNGEFWYGGFDFDSATPVAVDAATPNAGPIDIVLPSGGFTGTLTNGSQPLTYRSLYFAPTNGDPGSSTQTDGNGEFEVRYLPAGDYTVSLSDIGQIPLPGIHTTDGLGLTPLTLQTPNGSITGTVYQGANPVDGNSGGLNIILANLTGGQSRSTQVDSNGNYQFNFVADGTYVIRYSDWITGGDGFAPGVTDLADALRITIDGTTQTATADIALPDGSISGTLFVDGTPMSSTGRDVEVKAINLENGTESFGAVNNGVYSLTGLLAGDYRVRFTSTTYDPATGFYSTESGGYYPGVGTRSEATTVTVGDDEAVVDADIDVPTGTISGTILEDGIAIDGTTRNVSVTLRDFTHEIGRRAQVQADGTYTFGFLPDATYIVGFQDIDTKTRGYYPDGTDVESATPVAIDVANHDHTQIDIDLIDAGSVVGTVTDENGQGVEVLVFLTPFYPNDPSAENTYFGGLETYTNPDGSFSFDPVAVGNYRLSIEMTDVARQAVVFSPSTLNADAADVLTVTNNSEITADVAIPARTTISGHVVDDNGVGLPGVAVWQWSKSPEFFNGSTSQPIATTDSNGDYASDPLLPRDSQIEFRPDFGTGFPSSYYGGAPVRNAAEVIEMLPGDTLINIDGSVGLPGSISGTITDDNGNPTASWVTLIAEGSTEAYPYDSPNYGVAAPDGTYSFDNIPPGNWVVQAQGVGPNGYTSASAYATTYSGGTLVFGDAVGVTVQFGSTATGDVQMLAGQVIRGQVTAPDGQPLAGVTVSTGSAQVNDSFFTYREVITGADGRYELRGLTPGDVLLGFFIYGNTPWLLGENYPNIRTTEDAYNSPFTIAAIGTSIPDVNVQLEAAITGKIRVIDSNGDTVTTGTGFEAWFSILCESPGIPTDGYGSCSGTSTQNFTGQSAGDGTHYFFIPPGTYNAGATFGSSLSPEFASLTVDYGDTFTCDLANGPSNGLTNCTVETGGATNVAGTISGTVLGPDGQPLAGASVSLRAALETVVTGDVTDANGNYLIEAPEGTYQMLVNLPSNTFGNAPDFVLSEWYHPTERIYFEDKDQAAEFTILDGDPPVTGIDFGLLRAVDGTVAITGGALPLENDVYVTICDAPSVPAENTGFGDCVDPDTGQSSGYGTTMERVGDSFSISYLSPGTYTIGAIQYDENLAVISPLTEITTFTVLGSEQFVCDLPLIGTGTATCVVSTWVAPPSPDLDGVDATEEDGAPGDGDGDGDGTPDSEQSEVTSVEDTTIPDPEDDGSNYITLVSTTDAQGTSEPAPLTDVSLTELDENIPPPPSTEPQTSLISFTADFRDPVTGDEPTTPVVGVFEIYLPEQASQYWKFDTDSGTWTNATSLVTFDPAPTDIGGVDRWRVVLSITDGGFGDADGVVNGIIEDPGMFTSTTRHPRHFWHFRHFRHHRHFHHFHPRHHSRRTWR